MLDFLLIYSRENHLIPDNVCDLFIDKQIKECMFNYRESYYFLSKNRRRLAVFCTTDLYSHAACSDNKGINFFDGILIQEEACTDIRTIKPILEGGITDHSEVFGNYCYGLFSEDGINHIHGTILATYALFIGFSDNITVISNNPHMAAHAIYGDSYKDYKNIRNTAWIPVIGSTKDLSTAYDNVFLFPQNSGVSIDNNNTVSFYSLCNTLYYKMSTDEWNEHFNRTYQKLLKFLSLYYKKGLENKICGEITGGFDSRVTLALSIEAGIHKNIPWHVIGYKDHPDVIIARSIAKKYGLTLNCHEPQSYTMDEIESYYNVGLMMLHKTAGMLQFSEAWGFSEEYRTPFLVSGIAGEMFHGYNSRHVVVDEGRDNTLVNNSDIEYYFDHQLYSSKNSLNMKVLEYYHTKFMNAYKSFEELYSLDLIHYRTRAPQFHGGLPIKTIHPFNCTLGYNSWLHRLAMIEAPELRASCDIPFKLIEKSTPGLLYIPFGNKTWPFFAYANHKDREKISAIKPVKNIKKRFTSVGIYHLEKMKLLLHHNIQLHDSIYEIYNENFINQIRSDSVSMVSGKMKTNKNTLSQMLDIYGISLFMNHQEIPPNSGENIPAANAALPLNYLTKISGIYTPEKTCYQEPAKQVIDNGELCFQESKVFCRGDHNQLSTEEKRQFSLQIKIKPWNIKNTVVYQGLKKVKNKILKK
ncbi:hypothetical protein FACS189491_06520 [Spirochaetia bacterium]|nr:hypothetical protein FACS189491_06520 [Spirochaetia bacterium]